MNSIYSDVVSSLGNYVNAYTGIDNAITTTATTGTGWYQLGQAAFPIGGAIGGGLYGGHEWQLQQGAIQQQAVQSPKKKTFSRVLDALRSEIKEWCGDALVMA